MKVSDLRKHLDTFPDDATVVFSVWTGNAPTGREFYRPHVPCNTDRGPWLETDDRTGRTCAVVGTADACIAHMPTMKKKSGY